MKGAMACLTGAMPKGRDNSRMLQQTVAAVANLRFIKLSPSVAIRFTFGLLTHCLFLSLSLSLCPSLCVFRLLTRLSSSPSACLQVTHKPKPKFSKTGSSCHYQFCGLETSLSVSFSPSLSQLSLDLIVPVPMSVPDSAINVFGLCPKSGFNKFLNFFSFARFGLERLRKLSRRRLENFVFWRRLLSLFMPLTLGLQFNAMLGLEGEGTRGGGEEVEVEQSLDWLIVNSLAQKRIIMIILLLLFK